jgi:3-mercaptopyruvate sulfurtransferase SseA
MVGNSMEWRMSAAQEWTDRTKRFMKAELKRRDVTYEELAHRLSEMGIEETKASVASKLSRGGFTAAFFLASMKAVGCPAVRIEDV